LMGHASSNFMQYCVSMLLPPQILVLFGQTPYGPGLGIAL